MNPHDSPQADEVTNLLTGLTNQYSRPVLAYFQETSDEVARVEDLAGEISEQVDEEPDLVASRLHHSTLPRLEDVGVVEYDARSNTVRYRGRPSLEPLLDRPAEP